MKSIKHAESKGSSTNIKMIFSISLLAAMLWMGFSYAIANPQPCDGFSPDCDLDKWTCEGSGQICSARHPHYVHDPQWDNPNCTNADNAVAFTPSAYCGIIQYKRQTAVGTNTGTATNCADDSLNNPCGDAAADTSCYKSH